MFFYRHWGAETLELSHTCVYQNNNNYKKKVPDKVGTECHYHPVKKIMLKKGMYVSDDGKNVFI